MDLDRHDVADLVRLRAALEHAKLLAQDRTERGRHVALISLDGAVEYAMWLVVQHVGLPIPERASFHDAMNKLIGHFSSSWQQPGRRGVIHVHAARNQAQHGGSTPDPALMDGWVDEIEAFVQSLTFAAFGVALHEILLASAIDNEVLRNQITAAELAIDAAVPELAFASAYETFLAARVRWRDQQGDAYNYMALQASFDADPAHIDPAGRSTDYADVSVFASDLGEYHWLIATRRHVAQGVPVNLDDARRALQFVYHWILRWQTFDARYPSERWRQYFDSLTPPSVGDGQTPEIQWAEVGGTQMIGPDERRRVVVQLANLPERGRDDWGVDINQALEVATAKVGVSVGKIVAGQRTTTGQFTFFVDLELTADQVAASLQITVEEATCRYAARREETQQRDAEANAQAAAFTEFFAQYDDLFGAAHASRQVRADGESILVSVDYSGSLYELGEIASIFRSRGRHLANTHQVDGRLAFDAFPLDARNRAALEEAIDAAVDQVNHRRQFAEEREQERQLLEQGLQSHLGAPPVA
jgi:hypothetical protein